MLAVPLTPELEKRLTQLAERTGRSQEFYALEAIKQHLEDLEDYYLAAEAAREPGKTYSADEAKRELGLDII